MKSIIDDIANDLNIPKKLQQESLNTSRKLVKHIKIPKRDGGYRLIYQPSKKVKVIQYWLIANIFSKMKIHPAATAFVKRSSIKRNALIHKKGKYFLKLDFKDFFPSISFEDFKPILKDWVGSKYRGDYLDVVRLVCFYKNDSLPIGYPTSPIISNIVMYNFDTIIFSKLSNKEKYGIVNYSRYADDMTFSTNLKGACRKIKSMVEETLKEISSPCLHLNPKKTIFASASGGSALVTGLRICYDGHLTIHRKYKDKIRLLLSLYKKNKLSDEEILSLTGHLSYIKFVDGAFYTKIQNKYFKSIQEIIQYSPTSL